MATTSVVRAKVEVEAVTIAVTCNVCGQTKSAAEHGPYEFREDMFPLTFSGGWGSSYPGDMNSIRMDVCGPCLKRWVDTFAVPPEKVGVSTPTLAKHSETGEDVDVWGHMVCPHGTDPKQVHIPEDDELFGETYPEWPAPGVYRHFKGGLYQVLSREPVWMTPPHEPMVVYRSLEGDSPMFVRPLSSWNEVVGQGPGHPRFAPVIAP